MRPLRPWLGQPLLAVFALATVAIVATPHAARATPWIFKYDQFPDELGPAANAVNGGQFYVQPGFVQGEAFGQIYKPLPEMFPLQVTGFDLILAAPPNSLTPLFSNATIEIYNSNSITADPGTAPLFTISTGELFNVQTNDFGLPLQGNVGIHVDFDLSSEENRPPMLTSGKIWLVVRFDDAARNMSSEWGTLDCDVIDIGGFVVGCGCQNVATVHDAAIEKGVNVIHYVTPLGQCSGSKVWGFMESLSTGGTFRINGDVIMRLHADVAATPCVPQCDGKTCGDDTCGGSCGVCTGGLTCVSGTCAACQPNCLSKQCGPNGCGGSCGECGGNQTCGADFFCRDNCVPNCAGKACGDDGCGGSCGTCTTGTCNAGRCEAPCAPACSGRDCGADGCGGSCGTCDGNETCTGGLCVAACQPDCDGKGCGDDGCGGTCGTCGAGATCTSGTCQDDLAVIDVSPDFGSAALPVPVSITGRGFLAGAVARIGGTVMNDTTVIGTSLITATVPAGLAPGRYTVIVVNPGGALAQSVDAFEVRASEVTPTGGATSDGCGAGDPGLDRLGALLGLVLGVMRLSRTRRRC